MDILMCKNFKISITNDGENVGEANSEKDLCSILRLCGSSFSTVFFGTFVSQLERKTPLGIRLKCSISEWRLNTS